DPAGPETVDDVGRDELDTFDPSVFVDPFLVPAVFAQTASADSLNAQAFDRYYVQNRRLRGLHSLFFVDEVALVSVCEAVHRGWERVEPPTPEPPPVPSPEPPPDFSEFQCCYALRKSNGADAPVPAEAEKATEPLLPELQPLADFTTDALISVQQALTNFCQARRDMVGILTLPAHFEKRQCVEWQEEFRDRLGLPRRRSSFNDVRDIADLSYVAVYHPWLLVADERATDRLRAVTIDGAVCGQIAARERERQVWVAPANMTLQGVLGLSPVINTSDWADLFELQFNLARPEPRDFRVMSAHTLADERIWLQVSVRRLMILLRKVAVERGMDFVFEGNHERFREGVRLTLNNILRFMFDRGAFAGRTPAESYVVTTDESVNTPQSVDAGRFIAQIQVAPSQPLEFITVTLVRIGEDLLQAREA
ncbi:MAG TPA: phage tail sheath C-terminal domain-containing protein, partial [Pyrinomonadaceae bacterium]|nr:phage tail sheath C-terminal domain-containing protein [Pyrinomonadaceae bacterium]